MHFTKQPSPDSLAPLGRLSPPARSSPGSLRLSNSRCSLSLRAFSEGLFHLTINRAKNPLPHHTPPLASEFTPDPRAALSHPCSSSFTLTASDRSASFHISTSRSLSLSLTHHFPDGSSLDLIPHAPNQIIGFNADKFAIGLRMPEGTPYYGFGEKTGPLNKSGRRMKFWNLDVCADLPTGFDKDGYDPTYCAIPLAIWLARDPSNPGRVAYAACLIDNAGPSFFNCHTKDFLEDNFFYFGTYSGEPSFYFLTASTFPEICAKVARLTGRAEMPPLWSLGTHQCRWGYDSESVYRDIIDTYRKHAIPLAAFWLDIDYMDRYRVFTWDSARVPDPKRFLKWASSLGTRIVTIIDPGVAAVPGNPTFEQGTSKDLFCKSPSGRPFVGMVWPGKTLFPDYSLPECRAWWASKIKSWLDLGVSGIWNDMNDPATGACDVDDMLFSRAKIAHAHYHNLYGSFMAQATHDGCLRHDPRTRPFILTRSASTGIQRHAAVWTGDNVSTWDHLRMSIPESLNLSLSGVSFNGPDIGGFIYDTNAELLLRWYQAALLFPFFRNHSNNETVHQEPWCFGTKIREAIRSVILLRYRLLGCLYTCFADHIASGAPMLRPLCYFSSDPLYRDIQDSYTLGDNLVVAPILHQGAARRMVALPPGHWLDCSAASMHTGGSWFERSVPINDVPLFLRAGSIIAEPLPPRHSPSFVGWDYDLRKVRWRLHILPDSAHSAAGSQLIDDGITRSMRTPQPSDITLADNQLTGSFPFERISEISLYGPHASRSLRIGRRTLRAGKRIPSSASLWHAAPTAHFTL